MTKLYLRLNNETESAALIIPNLDLARVEHLVRVCTTYSLSEVRFHPDDYELRALESFPEMPTDGYLGDDFTVHAAPGDDELDDDFRIECCQLAVDRHGNIQFHALPKYYNDPFSTEAVSLQELTNHG